MIFSSPPLPPYQFTTGTKNNCCDNRYMKLHIINTGWTPIRLHTHTKGDRERIALREYLILSPLPPLPPPLIQFLHSLANQRMFLPRLWHSLYQIAQCLYLSSCRNTAHWPHPNHRLSWIFGSIVLLSEVCVCGGRRVEVCVRHVRKKGHCTNTAFSYFKLPTCGSLQKGWSHSHTKSIW